MGGSRITFRNLRVDCLRNSNLYLSLGGSGATTPTDIVCDSASWARTPGRRSSTTGRSAPARGTASSAPDGSRRSASTHERRRPSTSAIRSFRGTIRPAPTSRAETLRDGTNHIDSRRNDPVAARAPALRAAAAAGSASSRCMRSIGRTRRRRRPRRRPRARPSCSSDRDVDVHRPRQPRPRQGDDADDARGRDLPAHELQRLDPPDRGGDVGRRRRQGQLARARRTRPDDRRRLHPLPRPPAGRPPGRHPGDERRADHVPQPRDQLQLEPERAALHQLGRRRPADGHRLRDVRPRRGSGLDPARRRIPCARARASR